ncbi:DUF2163 domain-containing protein [Paenirhodobacter sp.]|uniref:DUF2163 domain-containing protein n=1 Tax=Paenirhodobacter sp. TaxID=1965326 RepID=UPI003B3C9225
MSYPEDFQAHMATGCTTVARAWAVARKDGRQLGFTDHDGTLVFEGITFEPDSGMTARALAQGTGLSVDNSEAYGALSSDAIREEDILAGRYDGAEVRSWLVNWADVSQRALIFRGTFGEISRGAGAFTVELRGLTEPLGQEKGQIYHPRCSAILGDRRCKFATLTEGYFAEIAVETVQDARVFRFDAFADFAERWFEKGRFQVLSGKAAGLIGIIKNDRTAADGSRTIELWQRLGAEVSAGDMVRLEAGCDRRAETCRMKFDNFLNFRGFPHIPGEDWLTSYPVSSGTNDGGSLFK